MSKSKVRQKPFEAFKFIEKKGESGIDENDSQWVKLLKKTKIRAIPISSSNIYKKDAIIEHQNMGVGFVP